MVEGPQNVDKLILKKESRSKSTNPRSKRGKERGISELDEGAKSLVMKKRERIV